MKQLELIIKSHNNITDTFTGITHEFFSDHSQARERLDILLCKHTDMDMTAIWYMSHHLPIGTMLTIPVISGDVIFSLKEQG